jgi:hypothetical protein
MSMFVFRQAVHIMVHVKLGAPQAKKMLDVSSGFECDFNGLSRPCRPHAVVCYFFLKIAWCRLLMLRPQLTVCEIMISSLLKFLP